MLHELLLSLSGHPSSLLRKDDHGDTPGAASLSPQEQALLGSIAHLSQVHSQIITATKSISLKQKSSICQAVASSIKSTQLARFSTKVLQVERDILRKDVSIVGDYDIVPLTVVVDAFGEWSRRMEWFLEICQYIQRSCTGPQLINYLRTALKTGYTDIEQVAHELVIVAENAWLRQLCTWLLYGRLPSIGANDFMIVVQDAAGTPSYHIRQDLVPQFVTQAAASSILFIGDCFNQIRIKDMNATAESTKVQSGGLQLLSALSFPISSSTFARSVSAIRSHLSQTVLRRLLPQSQIIKTLSILHEYFLLGRGEFALALIQEADKKTRGRWRTMENATSGRRPRLNDIPLKEAEIRAVLSRTWTAMAALEAIEDDGTMLNTVRNLISIHTNTSASGSNKELTVSNFNDLLLSVPASLIMRIVSPLDLFLDPSDIQVYSNINAYLLSIRRGHTRLADLWKVTPLRRTHPAPLTAHVSNKSGRTNIVQVKRQRDNLRTTRLRKVWATSSAAVFLLAQTEAYLHGEVVKPIWDDFHDWLSRTSDAETQVVGQSDKSYGIAPGPHLAAPPSNFHEGTLLSSDPQTLSLAHRACLRALFTHLLLAIPMFTESMYALLKEVDYLVASAERMQTIWTSLDLETDEGVVDPFLDLQKEAQIAEEGLSLAAVQVKQSIENVLTAMRYVDQAKDEMDMLAPGESNDEAVGYVPVKVGRIDRLLMKLDFGG